MKSFIILRLVFEAVTSRRLVMFANVLENPFK
jgi:hypothetical protein